MQVWDAGVGAVIIQTLESHPDFEKPVKTGREVHIDSQGGHRARTAMTELCIGQVETPAAEVPTEDEREVIGIGVRGERLLPLEIGSWVVLLGRIAAWQPSIRRPLLGNEVMWRAYVQLQTMVRETQADRAP